MELKGSFVGFLIEKGYKIYTLDTETMKYKVGGSIISSLGSLDNRYIHEDNSVLLDKINKRISVMDKDFTFEDRKGEICWGLNECGHPPTLVSPRPRILETSIIEDQLVTTDVSDFDSKMNEVLSRYSFDEIFEAMYDRSKYFILSISRH